MSYQQLLGELDEWFARGVAEAGPGVVLCRRGCAACCHGPFDISPADAQLVAGAVSRLDPVVRAAVQLRAQHQVSEYAEIEPDWSSPWAIDDEGEHRFDRLSERLANAPCPALGDDNTCLIYDDRPANCRMIGLPMVTLDGGILENACPIIDTSAEYAALRPIRFDLTAFEDAAEDRDAIAMTNGWVSTTVAGAIQNRIRES